MGLDSLSGPGCVLIGSGPSLNTVDVDRLLGLDTLAFNRSYIAWAKWGFAPRLFACLDPIVLEDNVREIQTLIEQHLRTTFFLHHSASVYGIQASERVSHVTLIPGNSFASHISALTDFGNVGATSLQILALLGYRRVAMVGIDARYAPLDDSSRRADRDGFVRIDDDPNHFSAEYARGRRLSARPDLDALLAKWPRVADECAIHSVDVRVASSGSALECFRKIDFVSAIEWAAGASPMDGKSQLTNELRP